jgi:acyl dehydratase
MPNDYVLTRQALLAAAPGQEIGLSGWFEISQARIDAFADVTEDWQFIHLDPVRAAHTPFGGTVAHGFLTLSMLSAMSYDAMPHIEGMSASVNYGFDAIRFIAPVRAGSFLRGRFVLDAVEARDDGGVMARIAVKVEIRDADRPALSAQWRILYLF